MKPPPIHGVLETVVYCTGEQLDDMKTFYSETLGLRPVFDKHPTAFRVGAGVLLIFDADESAGQKDPPPHGATGSVHACLVTSAEAYEGWKLYLPSRGIAIEREMQWPSGPSSFYFKDPGGNLLEIANGDLWPS